MAGQAGGVGKAAGPGFVVERGEGVDRLRIPARRYWYLTLITILPLVMMTAGELIGLALMASGPLQWFGTLCFAGWTWGWLIAVLNFAALFWAAEVISVSGGAIDTRFGLWPGEVVRRFDATAIRNLKAGEPADLIMTLNSTGFGRARISSRELMAQRGAVSFDYEGQRHFIAHDLEEEQGREVVAWLAKRLPVGSVGE